MLHLQWFKLFGVLRQKRERIRNLISFHIGSDGIYRNNEIILEDNLAVPADVNI